ncbi:hypothetical protein MB02_12535 [Croceicoccus estronivorus]|uniref:helix-turn-helix domain-containing protein n=1 Tax=Croceicoccus estronivorus TaxID=1172626 RepID=UPI00082BD766|nr:helix-turn-helix transcriptional regulator [Croceicoccus estronivorus]OCC23433.1 hypothetical protein MB02_12535 [Croceicoccus estronivorus]
MRELEAFEQMEDVERLLAALKRILRQKGIRQTLIAEKLQVSEATVRRYLSGKGMTLQILGKLCQIADIRIVDLAEMAHNGEQGLIHRLSHTQEIGVAESVMCAFVFYLLRYGWTPEEVRVECGLNEPQLVAHLVKLDRLGLIRLMPNNNVRILTVKYPDWHQGGPVRRTFDRTAKKLFQTIDYNGPRSVWELETLKLSPASVVQLDLLMKDFVAAVRALALDDRRQMRAQMEWHCIITAAHPVNLQHMLDE